MAYQSEPQPTDPGAEGDERAAGAIDPNDLVRIAAEFARENPHAALGAALGLGFLLGGGLTPRLLASVAMFAGRRYLAEAARDALEAAAGQQIEEAVKRAGV